MTRGIAIKRRTLILLLCAAYPAIVLEAAEPQLSSDSPAKVSPLPNGVELARGSSLLDVQILENGVVDVHALPDGTSTSRTLVIDPHPALRQPSTVDRSEKNGYYTLSTPGMKVQVQEASPNRITFFDSAGRQLLESTNPIDEGRDASVSMLHAATDTLYGVHGLDREETNGTLTRESGGKVAAGVQGNSGAPFIFSVDYGLLVDSDGGEFTAVPGSFSFRHSSRTDVEYFVFIGPPLETIAALSRLVGPPPLPPEWTLGFLNSQWGSTQSEVENIIATYRKHDLPIDGFILDFDWKAWGEDEYGEWRWNSTSGPGNVAPNKFPGGASGEFAKEMSDEGIKLSGILKPRILTTIADDPNHPTAAAAYATDHGFWYPGEEPFEDYLSHRSARDLDFRNSEERTWFWHHLLPAFHAGMVGWWNDEADVSGNLTLSNFEFFDMGRALYDGQRGDSNTRVWSINRNFYLGASRYGYAGWSGDIDTGFASMALQRRRMLAALDTGEFHWSMDTGGFSGHPNDENYARWMEFAAFVPIMRVHGGLDEKRQPWVYGPVAEDAARQALDLRYQLLPYIYSYERRNTEGEIGLVRPLFWEFPRDLTASREDSEWMFGDALLVAPVVTEGETTQDVYLPAGEWFDYASGRRYKGEQHIQIAVDSKTWKDIPLFVRSGSILATQPLEQFVGQYPVKEITLDIFPADSETGFTAYDDDGDTYDYEKGVYLRQQIAVQRSGGETQIRIDGATGDYSGPLRTYLLRIHTAASKVAFNTKPMPRAAASAFSFTPAANWVRQNDRFGPVILVRIPAGDKSPASITLR
ncbi:MAG: TIM-barrel domain-containing protein [Terracidiphilus sp.]